MMKGKEKNENKARRNSRGNCEESEDMIEKKKKKKREL